MDSRTRLLNATKGQQVDSTPVWFMRQAGRIFPEYRKIREDTDFLTLCRSPELNAKVTCMPVERLGVDAAIIFADILLILNCIGRNFRFVPGDGPRIDDPIREPDDVRDLSPGEPESELSYVYEAIKASINRLPDDKPLIGFAGAPFTIASYLIEGGKSRQFHRSKNFMFEHQSAWNHLMETITKSTIRYLESMIDAGAEIIQLFDSWVGSVTPGSYRSSVLPHVQDIFDQLNQHDVATIYFGTQTAGLLDQFNETGADVIGVDWRVDLERADELVGGNRSLQGNLDPALMLTEIEVIKEKIDDIMESATELPGHIFNLGHGLLPDTDPSTVKNVVEYVHSRTAS